MDCPAGIRARYGGWGPERADSGAPHAVAWDVWRAPRACRARGPRRSCRSEADHAADAGHGLSRGEPTQRSPRAAIKTHGPPRIASIATAPSQVRISSGSRTSRTSQRGPACSTLPSSSTRGAGAWLAGRWPPICGPSSCSTRSTWRLRVAGPRTSSTTRIRGVSTRRSRSGVAARRWVFARRWDPSATRTTTHSVRASFATLECALLDRRRFQTQAEARLVVFEYLAGWYNPHRRHSALGYESPINYERSRPLN
jgi:transposase InsO family protein